MSRGLRMGRVSTFGKRSDPSTRICIHQGTPVPSKKDDEVLIHFPVAPRKVKETDARANWSGPNIPSRASDATSQGNWSDHPPRDIQYRNSIFKFGRVQNSASSKSCKFCYVGRVSKF